MNKTLTFCAQCGRQMPKRAYRKTCASCRKIVAGWERVRVAGRTFWRQRRKAATA